MIAQLVRREGRRGGLTNWVIMVTIGPRANRDHDYPVGEVDWAKQANEPASGQRGEFF